MLHRRSASLLLPSMFFFSRWSSIVFLYSVFLPSSLHRLTNFSITHTRAAAVMLLCRMQASRSEPTNIIPLSLCCQPAPASPGREARRRQLLVERRRRKKTQRVREGWRSSQRDGGLCGLPPLGQGETATSAHKQQRDYIRDRLILPVSHGPSLQRIFFFFNRKTIFTH